MLRQPFLGLTLATTFAITGAANVSGPAFSQPADDMSGVTMSQGVIVDVGAQVAYVMSPDAAIVAVDVAAGREIWRSMGAEKPLALREGILVGQVAPRGVPNELTVATLDPQRGGALIARETASLPSDVTATIDDKVDGSFTVVASEDARVLIWESAHRIPQGVLPPDPDNGLVDGLPPTLEAPGTPETRAGAFRLDVQPDAVSLSSVDEVPPEVPDLRRMAVAVGPPPVAGVPEPWFLSSNGQHVMHPERVANDPTWDKYLWTIYETESGTSVGSFRTFASAAPFLVVEGRLVYQTPPFTRRDGEDVIAEPPMLRGVDLDNGSEVWAQPIRDTEYRGPFPP